MFKRFLKKKNRYPRFLAQEERSFQISEIRELFFRKIFAGFF
jgi:hypothetical protein